MSAIPTRLFLAAPFTQTLDSASGTVVADWRARIEAVHRVAKLRGMSVFSAHLREAWGRDLMAADICTPLDFEAMQDADVVCAFLGNPPSGGVQVELGWASALGKPILLILSPSALYSPLIHGLAQVTRVRSLVVAKDDDAATRIVLELDELISSPLLS